MRYWEIRDPIHGYIKVNELEKCVIDNKYVQRLKRIKQLGVVHVVYPGGEHSRFTHGLGTMYIAGKMGEKLIADGYADDSDRQILRLAGLLHDLGHGPFSHVFEDLLFERRGKTHEDLTMWLIMSTEIRDLIESYGYDPRIVAEISVGRYRGKKSYLNDVLVSGFCSDILDYLLRDSYYTGVEYGKIDVQRIVDSVSVVDGRLAVDATALYALEALVIARYEMFRAVYFHRTVRAATIMIREAMFESDEQIGLTSFETPEEYYSLVDERVIQAILDSGNKETERAKTLIKKLLSRELLKSAFEQIFHTRDRLYSALIKERRMREAIVERISEVSGVSGEAIYLDFPSILSVPHYPMREFPTFVIRDGHTEIKSLPSLSILVKSLSGYMNVIRVYTWDKYRKLVESAANDVFGSPHFALGISY